jgi:hypothetical protein
VLIASPGDLETERDTVDEVIRHWNSSHRATGIILQPLRWELDSVPALGDRTQGVINKQLVDNADFVVALFSTRLGTPTGVAVSGTAEEIERLRRMGKHVMVYFSNAPVPRDHNPEQLRLLNEYKQKLTREGLCGVFFDKQDLWQKVSHALATKMSMEPGVPPEATPIATVDLARLVIKRGQTGRSGDVKTVRLEVEVRNVAQTTWIRDYTVTVSIPSACLTFASAFYAGEIPAETPGRRRFRVMGSPVHPGEAFIVFATDIGIDQLMMKGTHLEGDVNAVLADKITVEAIVGEQRLTVEKPLSEFFPDATDTRVMKALEDRTLWKGSRPMTGSGDMAVRADELAEYLGLHLDDVNESLARLEQNSRVRNARGHLSDPTPRWHTARRF